LNENLIDPIKRLSEWALITGRHYQSEQTGDVHYFYGQTSSGPAQTIPIYENVCFVLALLRSRLVEAIQEAKQRLRHLLAFQIQTSDRGQGSFPIYLHQFPDYQDPSISVRVLAPFYWILKQFGHVLGHDLRQQIEQAVQQALEFSLKIHEQKPFPYFLTIRLVAAQVAFGKVSIEQLDKLAIDQLEGWHTTSQLADLLVGLQMVIPQLSASPWHPLWHFMNQTWHLPTGSYLGSHIREWEKGDQPQATLYDLFCGYFAGHFSKRAEQPEIFQLQGILIQPTTDRFETLTFPLLVKGHYKQQQWQSHLFPTFAYNLLEKQKVIHPAWDKTWTPFYFVWGDRQKSFSLVCQGGRYEKADVQQDDQQICLIFDLKEDNHNENVHKEKEVEFFLTYQSNVRLLVDGRVANTFSLNQPVILDLGTFKLQMQWTLLEGKGDFLGHWMRCHRPSQLVEENRESADWTFYLRALRREGPCRLQVRLVRQD